MKNLTLAAFICLSAVLTCGKSIAQDDSWELFNSRTYEFDSLKQLQYPTNEGGQIFYSRTTINGKEVIENWLYRELAEDTYEVRINYREGTTAYSEVYEVYKTELLTTRIAEDEYYDGFDQRLSISWSYDCFWLGDQMINMSSNGHGRSETDDWDAEAEAQGLFKKRSGQLYEMLTKH